MIALHLSARREPLAACAALCMSKESTRLVTRLLQLDNAELARLSGLHGEDFVLICGDAADLPWVDGGRLTPLRLDGVEPGWALSQAQGRRQRAVMRGHFATTRRYSIRALCAPGIEGSRRPVSMPACSANPPPRGG
jgi:MoxR-vWA-beta-propeller ternary system domain bpX5